jgi:hypothetical protein
MGFFDALTGRRKLKQPAPDRLFAMATAAVTIEHDLGLEPTGKGAIVFQPLATSDMNQIVAEMEEVLQLTGEETGTKIERRDDSFGYRWMVFSDSEVENLVVGLNAVNSGLRDGGYGERILAVVVAFAGPTYFIYNVKRGAWYPFVPKAGGRQERDNEAELRLKSQLERELPFEADLGRWFPLWDVPL